MAKYREKTHTCHVEHLKEYDTMVVTKKKIDAIFIGTSMMERFKWEDNAKKAYYEYGLDKYNILNFSCGGDKLQNILYRAIQNEELSKNKTRSIYTKIVYTNIRPNIIIFMAGANDIETVKPKKMFKMFKKIYDIYTSPYGVRSKIIVIGMCPRLSNFRSNESMNKLWREYNDMLKTLPNCEYYEFGDKMLDANGNIDKKYLMDNDLVHLNYDGYKIFAATLKSILQKHIPGNLWTFQKLFS